MFLLQNEILINKPALSHDYRDMSGLQNVGRLLYKINNNIVELFVIELSSTEANCVTHDKSSAYMRHFFKANILCWTHDTLL